MQSQALLKTISYFTFKNVVLQLALLVEFMHVPLATADKCSVLTLDFKMPCTCIGLNEQCYDSQGLRLLPGDVLLECEKVVAHIMSKPDSSAAQADAEVRYLANAETMDDAAEHIQERPYTLVDRGANEGDLPEASQREFDDHTSAHTSLHPPRQLSCQQKLYGYCRLPIFLPLDALFGSSCI